MSDWSAAAQTVGSMPPEAVKAELPLPYVAERLGFELFDVSGRVKALCPWHEDTEPSLDFFGERLERWGCYPCGKQGDLFDLIQSARSAGFAESTAIADQYLADFRASDWNGPTEGRVSKPFNLEMALDIVHQAELLGTGYLSTWLSERSNRPGLANLDADWLVDQFRVGEEQSRIIIPFFDKDGELVGYKHRDLDGPVLAASGSRLKHVLYGEWREPVTKDKPVLLCEGESDTWAAAHALGDEYTVLGLPTGAGTHPTAAPRFESCRVTLAFDGDHAGRSALKRWHLALSEVGATVRIVPMPEGADLCTLPSIRTAVRQALAVTDPPQGLRVCQSTYEKLVGQSATPVSNFVFEPVKVLLGPDGAAYEGRIEPTGEEAVLSSVEAASRNKLVSWALKHGVMWYGSDREAGLMLGYMQSVAPFLVPGKMSSTAGLVGNTFVFPGGSIGPEPIRYVAPTNDVHLEERISIGPEETPWRIEELAGLRRLHTREVMDPILAWLALAPLRSLLTKFPVLAVTGSSGSGKTTLLETTLRHFSGAVIGTNLTSTTRHALFSFVGATNGIPVWFDEYRPGARKDTMLTLEQMLRDAYTGQTSSKGGMGDNWAEVTSVSAIAPIVVSGEDAFSETSHTERMVLVSLPPDGRNPEALLAVQSLGLTGFSRAYLTWLLRSLEAGELPEIVNYQAGPTDLPDRQRYNMGALDLGWHLLKLFSANYGAELTDPHLGLVHREGAAAAASNPIRDALLWALDEDANYAYDAVCRARDENGIEYLYVRVENFVQYVLKHSQFVLPGGPQAVRKYLMDNMGAEPCKTRVFPGQAQKRALMMEVPDEVRTDQE